MNEPTLTDEEQATVRRLDALKAKIADQTITPAEIGEVMTWATLTIGGLVEDLRLLRLDEWLEKAAHEIHEDWEERQDWWLHGEETVVPGILAILRKHRDGNA